MIPNFAKQKYSWLDQVSADAALTPPAFKIAYRIAGYVNPESGEAWPSQERLAEECHVTRSGLRKAIRALVDAGHLDVVPGAGRIHTSRYRWVFRSDEKGPVEDTFSNLKGLPLGQFETENVPSEKPFPDLNVPPQKPVSNGKGSPQGHPTCPASDHQRVPPVATNNSNEKLYGTTLQAAEAASSKLDIDPKAVLFSDGLAWLKQATGRPEGSIRSALGQMLKIARDDAGIVLAAVSDAKRNNRAAPLAWIMGTLKARYPPRTAPANAIPSNFKLSKPAARA